MGACSRPSSPPGPPRLGPARRRCFPAGRPRTGGCSLGQVVARHPVLVEHSVDGPAALPQDRSE
eukprot:520640-Alexandrium_andersonii.AAC.1